MKTLSSKMTTGRQSKRVTRTSSDEGELKAAAETVKKMRDVIDAISAASGALRPEDEPAFQVLKEVM